MPQLGQEQIILCSGRRPSKGDGGRPPRGGVERVGYNTRFAYTAGERGVQACGVRKMRVHPGSFQPLSRMAFAVLLRTVEASGPIMSSQN